MCHYKDLCVPITKIETISDYLTTTPRKKKLQLELSINVDMEFEVLKTS